MKILKRLALLFIMSLPVIFAACSKDKDNGALTETVLVESATIQWYGSNVGIRLKYDDQNRVAEAYEYFLNENPTTHVMDTSNYIKYTFDRSVSGVVTSTQYYHNSADNSWTESTNSHKVIYSGSKANKIEYYYSNTLNRTETLTWSGDKLARIYNETSLYSVDSAAYSNGNRVDNNPSIVEYSYPSSYIKQTNSTTTTFNSYKNYLSVVPIEYMLISNYRPMMFPIGEYFSDNGINKLVSTYKNERYLNDSTTRTSTDTEVTTTEYTYTYGNLTGAYPTVVKQTITRLSKYEDFNTPSNNTETTNDEEVIINFSLIKK